MLWNCVEMDDVCFKIMKYKNVAWSLRSYLCELVKETGTTFFCKHYSHYKSMHKDRWAVRSTTICKQKLSSVAFVLITLLSAVSCSIFFFWRMNKVYQVLSLTGSMYPNLLMSSASEQEKKKSYLTAYHYLLQDCLG